jgi:hypothetical protein
MTLNQHKEYASEETNFDMVKDSKIDQAKKTFKPPKDDDEDFGVGTGGFDSLKEVCQEEEKPENL